MNEILVVARFAHYGAVVLLFGAALFPLYAMPSGAYRRADRGADIAFDAWLRAVLRLAGVAAILSQLVWFGAQAVMIAGSFDTPALWSVAVETGFGQVWLGRLSLALATLVLLIVPGNRVPVMVLAAAVVASLAGVGHASASTGGEGFARTVADALHLLAGAAWLGGLLPLGRVLSRARAAHQPIWRNIARQVLPRFSRMGYGAVGVLVLTGCVNSAFLVPSAQALIDTPYGRLLALKIGLFVLLLALAALNRLRLAPRIMANIADGSAAARDLAPLCRSVALEQGLGAAILAVVSVLGILAPPLATG